MTAVLVLEDGTSPAALAVVRSLHRAGARVGVGSGAPNPRVVASRACGAWHQVRAAERDLSGWTDDVRRACAAGAYDVVLAADDVELLALSAQRAALPVVVPLPPHETVLRAVDKLTLAEAAARAGVRGPRTEAADEPALSRVQGPVVVKSRLHWTPGSPAHDGRHLTVTKAADAGAARLRVAQIEAAHAQAVLQPPVHGQQIALSLVVDEAFTVRAAAQQRLVVSSLTDTSARAVTTPVEAPLLQGAVALLRELGWYGLVNLQYLQPARGAAQLIDFNGRPYGSLALAVTADADLPAVWLRLVQGEDPGPAQVARPAVRFHALVDDLQRARAQQRGGLLRDVAGTLRWGLGARAHTTLALTDPGPAWATLRELAGRRLPGGRSA